MCFASIAFLYCYRNDRDYWVEVVLRRTTFSATESKTLVKNLNVSKSKFPLMLRNKSLNTKEVGRRDGGRTGIGRASIVENCVDSYLIKISLSTTQYHFWREFIKYVLQVFIFFSSERTYLNPQFQLSVSFCTSLYFCTSLLL